MNATRTKVRLVSFTCALAATLAPVVAAGPAHAATRAVSDTEGDAPARLDITRYFVSNTSSRIRAVIRVKKLGKTGVFQQRYFDSAFDSEPAYGVQVRRDAKGHLHVHAFRDDENGDHDITCDGVRGHWRIKESRVVTLMPVSCASDVSFDPLHVYAASFDPGDLGVADATRTVRVARD